MFYILSKIKETYLSALNPKAKNRMTEKINDKTIFQLLEVANSIKKTLTESFFKFMKTELIDGNKMISNAQMNIEIFTYIKIWCSR